MPKAEAPKKKIALKKAKPLKKISPKAIVKLKKKKVSAIPKGYHSITPYLIMEDDAAQAINFYKKAFNAKEKTRMESPDKKIMHAELQIGDAKIMLSDACADMGWRGPKAYGGSPVGIHLYIKAVDEVVKKAVKNGAKIIKPVENMFYGDRSATLEDPYGHLWTVSTHVEDVTPTKMKKRMAELFNKKS